MKKFSDLRRTLRRWAAGLLTGVCFLSLPVGVDAAEISTLNPQTQEAWRFLPTAMKNVA